MTLRSGLLAAALVVAGIDLAAAETKPQYETKTKAAEVSVSVDARLRQHPGLFENLLAEGRKRAQRHQADAAKALRDEPDFFTEGRHWTFESSYSLRSVVGRYVSVVRNESTYSGGAHGNLAIDTILWDRDARRRMNIRPFFRETADNGPTLQALAGLARLAVAAEKLANRLGDDEETRRKKLTPAQYLKMDGQIVNGIQPALLKIGPIALTPSTEPGKSAGLTFYYAPYAVGSYAEGPYTVVVPWTAFKQFLSPQGAAIFGGEQPKDDEP